MSNKIRKARAHGVESRDVLAFADKPSIVKGNVKWHPRATQPVSTNTAPKQRQIGTARKPTVTLA